MVDVAEVVFATVPLLLLRESRTEVVLEVAAEGRDPGETPAHALLIAGQLLERADRLDHQGHVVAVEVREGSVEVIGDEGAAGASRVLLVDPEPVAEHEVVDEQLRAPVEELGKGLLPIVRLEDVLLLDPDPGQLLASACQVVAPAHVFLLGVEQLPPCCQPLVSARGSVLSHHVSPSVAQPVSPIQLAKWLTMRSRRSRTRSGAASWSGSAAGRRRSER